MSRYAVAILSLLIGFSGLSQQLTFRGERIDTIRVRSHLSAYQFDDHGTTKGAAEIYSIVYSAEERRYVVDEHYKDKYAGTFKPVGFNNDRQVVKSSIGKPVVGQTCLGLIGALSGAQHPTRLISQIDTTQFLSCLTRKRIRQTAKKWDIGWYFRRKYSSREENERFYDACRSIDTLGLYLESFRSQPYTLVTDYANTIHVVIYTSGSKYVFEGKYPHPCRQPWFELGGESGYSHDPHVNLKINHYLEQLLPSRFLLRESLSTEWLFERYLAWYFERRGMG